jgi:uncharacterized caspase-like protein
MGGWRAVLCVAILALAAMSSPAAAEKRVALVIGNDRYDSLPDLNNARRDATDIAEQLRKLGFETELKTDVTERTFGRTLARFGAMLEGADVGLVFYAGHGIQVDGRNYLVPSDGRVEVEEDLPYEAIPADRLLSVMREAGTPLNIVILDACRDNPLPQRTRSAKRGLAVVQVPAGAEGTAILYSAGPGQVAEDGPPGGNGVFTAALLEVLGQPGLVLEEVFKIVNRRVREATGNTQKPFLSVSMHKDFYFVEND